MYKLGKKVSDDGVWKEFSGARLKIARAGNVEFLKGKEALEKPYRKRIERGTLDPITRQQLTLRSIARGILIDWEGVQDEDGKAVAYTEDLGTSMLADDPDVLEFVMDTALDNDNYTIKRVESISKKSVKASAG